MQSKRVVTQTNGDTNLLVTHCAHIRVKQTRKRLARALRILFPTSAADLRFSSQEV